MNGRRLRITILLVSAVGLLLASRIAPQRAVPTLPVHAAPQAVPTFRIDHTMVDAGEIPQAWLDAARQLDTFFAHRSLGNNIIDGMLDLAATNPARYAMVFGTGGPDWFDDHSGINHVALGSNKYPQTKIDGFDDLIRGGYGRADLAMMKFCPGDSIPFGTMPAADIWREYRDMMVRLETDYPDLALVWWTFPLSTASDNRGNDQKAIFNAAVRQHCAANGCRLFDIADIQSHDPSGTPVVSATGHEAMWDGYSDDGGHLNGVGRLRVAQAFWWMLATAAQTEPGAPWVALEVTPAQLTLQPNGTGQLDATVTAENLLTPVTLGVANLPPGLTLGIAPNPVTPPGVARITLTAGSAAPPGTTTLTVIATAGQLSATADVALTIEDAPGFAVDVQPAWQQAHAGDVVTYTIALTSLASFNSPVNLSVAGLPPEMTAEIADNPVVPPAATELRIVTSAVTAAGNHTLGVTGDGGGQRAAATFDLTIVSADPAFTLAIQPPEIRGLPGQVVTFTVAALRREGFDAPVALEATGLPAEVGTTWENNPLLPNAQARLALSVPRRTTCGSTMFVVVGTAGDVVITATATLTIYSGGYLPFVMN